MADDAAGNDKPTARGRVAQRNVPPSRDRTATGHLDPLVCPRWIWWERLEAVCVGAVGEIGSDSRKITSAFVKTPVPGRVAVGPLGLPGDEHVYKDHGGPDFALLAYPKEHYAHWSGLGLELPAAGAMGENLTTVGLVESEVHIGDVFEAGTSVMQVTEPRSPCHKIATRFGRKDMTALVRDSGFTGFLLRVLVCGDIAAGDALRPVASRRSSRDVCR